ncbi:hypothetical protein [Methylobacterium pseudosasicola]|uniref:Uncharacterized protein n=1 Tax=Methylobacterium pseudosasicola TaxID=582667 RepID=A0A1I4PT72_9HYPH|nr:hypothetical protein [Methylobacterium pseudosasicola]SFM30958.1 hypothetical protein SAMN05192568_102648 [Methylobacterium pseudosasicola]
MSKLHYVRVRRARGLAMPLPTKPKARPLGPKVLCYWRDVPIRMRADVEKAGTWDEFLDTMAAEQGHALSLDTFPPLHDRAGHRCRHEAGARARAARRATGFLARVRVAMDRKSVGDRRKWDALADIERARIAGPPSFFSWLFGRAA